LGILKCRGGALKSTKSIAVGPGYKKGWEERVGRGLLMEGTSDRRDDRSLGEGKKERNASSKTRRQKEKRHEGLRRGFRGGGGTHARLGTAIENAKEHP